LFVVWWTGGGRVINGYSAVSSFIDFLSVGLEKEREFNCYNAVSGCTGLLCVGLEREGMCNCYSVLAVVFV
jgi:hypothetical protein